MGQLCERVPAVTGQTGRVGLVDQGHAGEETEHAAAVHDVELQAGKKLGGQTGFVPLPRRRVVERGFAWRSRFRRWARVCERLSSTLQQRHFAVFACIVLARYADSA